MKNLLLESISVLSEDSYAVSFSDRGDVSVVTCVVKKHDEILFVEISPDVFMTGEAVAKPISAAVVAFHNAVAAQSRWADGAES